MNNLNLKEIPNTNEINMLVIDDDVQLCNSIKFYLEDQNYNVFTSNDGSEGKYISDQEEIHLILVDLNMPKVDGLEVIQHINKNYPNIPVIVVSATGNINNFIDAIRLGAWDFVTKPIFNFSVLEHAINRALEKAGLIAENNNYRTNLERLVNERTNQLEEKAIELEKINEELNKAKISAESSDKLKSEFLAQMSHEIRSPINVIQSYLSIMFDESFKMQEKEIGDGIKVISNSFKRLIRTIELIIYMSELESEAFRPVRQKLDLIQLVENVLGEYHQEAEKKNIKLKFHTGDPLILLDADKHSLTQILNNLIDNAVKYTQEGHINVIIENNEESLSVLIRDSGIGMTEEYLKRIFEPFSQEQQGYTRAYEGNGLGLALVKKYCDLNNYKIDIKSRKNIGTQVRIEIRHLSNN